jgi:biotin transport system substrate-specific component
MEKNLTHIALFAAFTLVLFVMPSAMLAVGVPISATSLGIMLCGTILGPVRGGLAALLFIVLVALGVPAMFGGSGGLGLFVGPRAGFLLGFPVAAFVTGLIMQNWRGPTGPVAFAAAAVGGILVLYAIGIPVMAAMLSAESLTKMFDGLPTHSSLPLPLALSALYIPGDLIKCVLAALITRTIAQMRPGALLSRA